MRRRGMSPLISLARAVSRPAVVTALILLSTACTMHRSSLTPAPDAVAVRQASSDSPLQAEEARAQPGQAGIGRLLIRRASMLLEVDNPEAVARRVATVTASLGGYIEQSRES